MRFLSPLYLILLIPLGVLYFFKFKNKIEMPSLNFPFLAKNSGKKTVFNIKWLYFLEILMFLFMILALMRPQFGKKEIEEKIHGYSIMLVMDLSLSMKAADLKPSRFSVAKHVLKEFIKKRPNDMLGFTIFSGSSITLIPLTINHDMILNAIDNLKIGLLDDGTAIGMGIASAVASLKNSKSKNKMIILLTDGDNNMGDISPDMAADIAKEFGIKIYAIGVGAKDRVPFPFKTPFGTVVYKMVNMKFNENVLKNIAQKTGGSYFRAIDAKSLQDIYENINKMEKSEFKIKYHMKYYDKFYIPLFISIILLLLRLFIGKLFFPAV